VQAVCLQYNVKFQSGMWKHRRDLITPDVTWGIIMGQTQQMWARLLRMCSTPLHHSSA